MQQRKGLYTTVNCLRILLLIHVWSANFYDLLSGHMHYWFYTKCWKINSLLKTILQSCYGIFPNVDRLWKLSRTWKNSQPLLHHFTFHKVLGSCLTETLMTATTTKHCFWAVIFNLSFWKSKYVFLFKRFWFRALYWMFYWLRLLSQHQYFFFQLCIRKWQCMNAEVASRSYS